MRDAKGKLVQNVRDGIKVKLDEANAAQAGRRSFQYDTGFTLAPGDYRLKFLARENQTGKMGTFETTFKVPDLAHEAGRSAHQLGGMEQPAPGAQRSRRIGGHE